MADGNQYPSVFVVDSYAKGPPVPPRLGQMRQRSNVAQRLLFLLVSLALFALTIQGCYLYRLYQSQPADLQTPAKLTSDGDGPPSVLKRNGDTLLPSKPMAHLTGGPDAVHGSNIMAWSTVADPLPYHMEYRHRRLYVEEEGYYYVYSKVYFSVGTPFSHSVQVDSPLYSGGNLTLLEGQKYSREKNRVNELVRSTSYLGGVFHLYKGDALFVQVSSTKQILIGKPSWNVFGAYMI
ncbi:tumor necrosis factor ligand superfamily member 14 [Genypterus blacodes]|uniref:tumor necrosis factor ligand superfamily member 14 n=1 Tax=Genypterus blacodes TaxID=154954 RepID=UPI003F761413